MDRLFSRILLVCIALAALAASVFVAFTVRPYGLPPSISAFLGLAPVIAIVLSEPWILRSIRRARIWRRAGAIGLMFAASAALTACAGLSAPNVATGVSTAAQTAEKADADANLLYAAIATGIKAYEALPSTTAAQRAKAESVKMKAWMDLLDVRAAYAAGKAISLIALTADQALAGATTGAPIAAPS